MGKKVQGLSLLALSAMAWCSEMELKRCVPNVCELATVLDLRAKTRAELEAEVAGVRGLTGQNTRLLSLTVAANRADLGDLTCNVYADFGSRESARRNAERIGTLSHPILRAITYGQSTWFWLWDGHQTQSWSRGVSGSAALGFTPRHVHVYQPPDRVSQSAAYVEIFGTTGRELRLVEGKRVTQSLRDSLGVDIWLELRNDSRFFPSSTFPLLFVWPPGTDVPTVRSRLSSRQVSCRTIGKQAKCSFVAE